jgi:hypothetical protein
MTDSEKLQGAMEDFCAFIGGLPAGDPRRCLPTRCFGSRVTFVSSKHF